MRNLLRVILCGTFLFLLATSTNAQFINITSLTGLNFE